MATAFEYDKKIDADSDGGSVSVSIRINFNIINQYGMESAANKICTNFRNISRWRSHSLVARKLIAARYNTFYIYVLLILQALARSVKIKLHCACIFRRSVRIVTSSRLMCCFQYATYKTSFQYFKKLSCLQYLWFPKMLLILVYASAISY